MWCSWKSAVETHGIENAVFSTNNCKTENCTLLVWIRPSRTKVPCVRQIAHEILYDKWSSGGVQYTGRANNSLLVVQKLDWNLSKLLHRCHLEFPVSCMQYPMILVETYIARWVIETVINCLMPGKDLNRQFIFGREKVKISSGRSSLDLWVIEYSMAEYFWVTDENIMKYSC
jgi:hypothetical protein